MDILQVIGTVLSLLAMGYGIGAWHERQHRSRRSLGAALNRVTEALSAVHLHAFEVSPNPVALGSQLTLTFTIENKFPVPLEVWLGADIEYGSPTHWFYDTAQDKVVTLDRGRHTYSRYLSVGPPLSAGRYRLNSGVWLGPKSQPSRSVPLEKKHIEIEVRRH
jgi:hypothetical protein